MYGPIIHSIGSRPSRAVLDGTLTCDVGFSGYLSAPVCAIPGNTDRPNPKSNRNETPLSMRMCCRPLPVISCLLSVVSSFCPLALNFQLCEDRETAHRHDRS